MYALVGSGTTVMLLAVLAGVLGVCTPRFGTNSY